MQKALCRQELQKHCCRRTRGTEETVEAIESLLLALPDATDALGMPLLREEMKAEASCQVHPGPSVSPVVY